MEVERIVKAGVEKRMATLATMDADFARMQRDKLASIVRNCADTEFGRAHKLNQVDSFESYRAAVPPTTATDYDAYWKRIAAGERNVLFPEPVYSFGLSSGTTGEPKMVPLTKALVRGLKRAIGYTTASYMARTGNYALLRGYALQMAAPPRMRDQLDKPVGYITGIMGASRTYPFHNIGIPSLDVLNEMDWGKKYDAIERRYADHDVRMIFGIPGYILGLLEYIAQSRGVASMAALWPELALVVTSGVALSSHRARLAEYCPNATFLEMYLCTEAAVACQPGEEPGLLPMLEDIVLEFVPEEDYGQERPPRFALDEVETGVRYVVLLTTPSGLFAYAPGDVVSFTSVRPPRMLVEGRAGNVLSLASEKLDAQQAARILERADIACSFFSVCPAAEPSPPGHEWIVELDARRPAESAQTLADRIDRAMREANPLIQHLREGNLLFARPVVSPVAPGTFQEALRRRPGQGKILRIYQHRDVATELLAIDSAR